MRKRTRTRRPQIKDLIGLRVLLPDSSQAIYSPHFVSRTGLRKFDVKLIRNIWNQGQWRPYERTGWTIELPIVGENLVWSLGVDFGSDDLPTISTICTRCPQRQLGGI